MKKKKKACLGWTWARGVWEDECIVRESGVERGYQYQCVAADWTVWENLRFFFPSCKPVTEWGFWGREGGVFAQRRHGSRDSPHLPRAPCSQRDDGTLVTSKCTPYREPSPPPFPANPVLLLLPMLTPSLLFLLLACGRRLYRCRVPSWMKVAFFGVWCSY